MPGKVSFIDGLIITVCLLGLMLVYLYQRLNYAGLLGIGTDQENLTFVVNRFVRLFLNDGLCVALIYRLFKDRPIYIRWAWWIFIAEALVILPLYLAIKLSIEGPTEISSPLLSPVHRIIVNPLLMFIFIAACYIQDFKVKSRV